MFGRGVGALYFSGREKYQKRLGAAKLACTMWPPPDPRCVLFWSCASLAGADPREVLVYPARAARPRYRAVFVIGYGGWSCGGWHVGDK